MEKIGTRKLKSKKTRRISHKEYLLTSWFLAEFEGPSLFPLKVLTPVPEITISLAPASYSFNNSKK